MLEERPEAIKRMLVGTEEITPEYGFLFPRIGEGSIYNEMMLGKFGSRRIRVMLEDPTWEMFGSTQESLETIVDRRMGQNLTILKRMMESIIERKLTELLSSSELNIANPVIINQFDLTPDQVKDAILKETKIGDVFYPSDIANKLGLDLAIVAKVIEELKKEGKITEKVS